MNINPHSSTILVTGGSGFVGAYVIRDLVKAGYKVRAIRRQKTLPQFISPSVFDKVDWIECDVFDVIGLEQAMTGADAVVHSAAVVSFSKSDHHRLLKTNIEGTANVVNAAISTGVKRFVHVSSVAAIGRTSNDSLVNENTRWTEDKTATAYSTSKYRGEMEVWRGEAEGLSTVIVNPSTILGYGDWNSSSSAIFRNVYNGFSWYTNGITGFVDVEDVASIIVRLLPCDVRAERFILSADNWSYRKVFDTIADAFGKRRPHREATPFLAQLAWRAEKVRSIFTSRKPLLTRETAKIAQSRTLFDNNKILKALPDIRFTPLEESISRACKLYTV